MMLGRSLLVFGQSDAVDVAEFTIFALWLCLSTDASDKELSFTTQDKNHEIPQGG
ncbi:hypothetical protein IQ259_18750 [Fortiea sp. LEGE XX443]|uniref:hypothetical protein n=1 Tax=Fortiea sp. LEGE XX443 TaxID=1828611 RepID=UPI001A03159B|nr:hypothetical protein [Fortiea sp. LEGE XX443]